MDQTLTVDQVFALLMDESKRNGNGDLWGVIKGTAIVMRESGGNTRAFRPASKNPNGGNDRGLWQWNDKWHPDISDTDAYNPVKATQWAYRKSGGFKEFEPWDGAKIKGSDIVKAAEAANRAGYDASKLTDTPVGAYMDVGSQIPIIGGVIDAAGNVVDDATDKLFGWSDALGSLLSNLIDANWWKRIGVGAIGILVIIVALVVVFAKPAAEIANPIQ